MTENLTPAQEQARELYFGSDLNQTQIAEKTGVTQKTISLWVNDYKWKLLKESYRQAPLYIISQMNQELIKINDAIASRQPDQQIPTTIEADLRHKILSSIKMMKERQSCGTSIETLMELFDFIKVQSFDDAKHFIKYANGYVEAKNSLEKKNLEPPVL